MNVFFCCVLVLGMGVVVLFRLLFGVWGIFVLDKILQVVVWVVFVFVGWECMKGVMWVMVMLNIGM